MRDYVGKYYSVEYIRKHILKQNEKEIDDMDKQIKKEIDDGIIASPQEQNTGGFLMSEEIKSFISNVYKGNNVDAGEDFKDAIRAKVGDALEAEKRISTKYVQSTTR